MPAPTIRTPTVTATPTTTKTTLAPTPSTRRATPAQAPQAPTTPLPTATDLVTTMRSQEEIRLMLRIVQRLSETARLTILGARRRHIRRTPALYPPQPADAAAEGI